MLMYFAGRCDNLSQSNMMDDQKERDVFQQWDIDMGTLTEPLW